MESNDTKSPEVTQKLQEKLKELQAMRDDNKTTVSRGEIIDIVTSIMDSLQGGFTMSDMKLYSELESLIAFIQSAKTEIAKLRPVDISEQHIVEATDELDAVVGATEEATGKILDATEIVEKVSQILKDENGQKLSEAATSIYEACNFQDITGQRITKVVKTLRYIENKINGLLVTLDQDLRNSERGKKVKGSVKPMDASELLNGPQLPQNANTQDSIDALFNNL